MEEGFSQCQFRRIVLERPNRIRHILLIQFLKIRTKSPLWNQNRPLANQHEKELHLFVSFLGVLVHESNHLEDARKLSTHTPVNSTLKPMNQPIPSTGQPELSTAIIASAVPLINPSHLVNRMTLISLSNLNHVKPPQERESALQECQQR